MIKVDDLIAWAKDNAVGRSTSYPNGWIEASALKELAWFIDRAEPIPYFYKRGEHDGEYKRTKTVV